MDESGYKDSAAEFDVVKRRRVGHGRDLIRRHLGNYLMRDENGVQIPHNNVSIG